MKKCTYWFLLAGAVLVWANCPTLQCLAKPTDSRPTPSAPHPEINWLTDYDAALKQAQSSNRLVVIDFYASWCGPCRFMEKTTFADTNVMARLAGYVMLKIDDDKNPQLSAKYGVPGLPTLMVTDATGKPVVGAAGYLDPADYLKILDIAQTRIAQTKNPETNSVK